MDHFDKERLLNTLINLKVFFPLQKSNIEIHLPFFDKTLLPLIDYLTIWDLIQLGGFSEDYPLVAVLLCMFDALQEGSLCLDLEKRNLQNRLHNFADKKTSVDTAENFLAALNQNQYQGFISHNRDEFRPLVLSERENRRLLYFQKYYVFENQLRKRIDRALLLSDTQAEDSAEKTGLDQLIQEIYSPERILRLSQDGIPIAMDPYQIKAIKMALSRRFTIISGGPGTGKTSLMVNILRCIIAKGFDPSSIILCAPTGRAAQRMTEAIYNNVKMIRFPHESDMKLMGLKASTLHKVLHYKKFINDFYFREQNPIQASVVIMDEVSMVDVAMMEKFLRAVNPSRTRLIFMGDKDQLPPVEAGAVFGAMIPQGQSTKTFQNHLVVLKNNFRSGKELQNLARQINSGKISSFEPVSFQEAMSMENDQWSVVAPETADQLQRDLVSWVNAHFLSDGQYHSQIRKAGMMNGDHLTNTSEGRKILEEIFHKADSSKIMTLIKEGMYGSMGINRFVGGYLSDQFKSFPDQVRTGVFSGALIIILCNDYSKTLFNGDTGVVIKDPQGIFRVYFKRFDSYVGFSIDLLPSWEPAYALTVHKCQGSEFDDVMVVFPYGEEHRLLTRQMIYTAVTRAKKKVVIYGKPSAFQNALKRKVHRESGLLW